MNWYLLFSLFLSFSIFFQTSLNAKTNQYEQVIQKEWQKIFGAQSSLKVIFIQAEDLKKRNEIIENYALEKILFLILKIQENKLTILPRLVNKRINLFINQNLSPSSIEGYSLKSLDSFIKESKFSHQSPLENKIVLSLELPSIIAWQRHLEWMLKNPFESQDYQNFKKKSWSRSSIPSPVKKIVSNILKVKNLSLLKKSLVNNHKVELNSQKNRITTFFKDEETQTEYLFHIYFQSTTSIINSKSTQDFIVIQIESFFIPNKTWPNSSSVFNYLKFYSTPTLCRKTWNEFTALELDHCIDPNLFLDHQRSSVKKSNRAVKIALMDTGINPLDPFIRPYLTNDLKRLDYRYFPNRLSSYPITEYFTRPIDWAKYAESSDLLPSFHNHGNLMAREIVLNQDPSRLELIPFALPMGCFESEVGKKGIEQIFSEIQKRKIKIAVLAFGSTSISCYKSWFEQMKKYPQVLFIVAAGNQGVFLEDTPIYPASFNLKNIHVVHALDSNKKILVTSNDWFSDSPEKMYPPQHKKRFSKSIYINGLASSFKWRARWFNQYISGTSIAAAHYAASYISDLSDK